MLLAGAAVDASAHQRSTSSTIDVLGWGATPGSPSNDYAYGIVESPKRECLGGRTVKILMLIGGKYEVIDTDRTSKEGFWAGGGEPDITSIDSRAKVTRENVGRPGHGHACKSDTVHWD